MSDTTTITPSQDASSAAANGQQAWKEWFDASWPVKGGADVPQPWDHDAFGGDEPVVPIEISHPYPILTSGSGDPSVQTLGRMLGDLGFANSVSRGENPFGSVDATVMAAVESFRSSYGVEEDPTGFGGMTSGGRRVAGAHIGPWTWEAVTRAHAHLSD